MNDAKRYCIIQSVDGSVTLNMHMLSRIFKSWTNGFVVVSVCVYGKVGNSPKHACTTLSNVEYLNGVHINGVMQVRDIGQWRIVE